MTEQSESSTFKLALKVGKKVQIEGQKVDREIFSHWVWDRYSASGLVGVHEGTLLSEEAAEKGLETESWTVDAGEAPRERDWIGGQEILDSELFFDSLEGAENAARELAELTDVVIGVITEQKPQDWDAEWKASFLGAGDGFPIPPAWRIVPAWVEITGEKTPVRAGEKAIRINPGAGFGTGTHETTQLCLEAIAGAGIQSGTRVLDFGSGSGILAIGAAISGADVDAVEIDPLAIDNALENARLNGVENRIHYSRHLEGDGPYAVVIANILRPVLLEFASRLVDRLAPGGTVILSGLIEKDVAEVRARYSELLGGRQPEERSLNEWRALVWRGVSK